MKRILTYGLIAVTEFGCLLGMCDPLEGAAYKGENPRSNLLDEFGSDLHWLVGTWRCVTRCYLRPRNSMLEATAEDSLDYFNVYYPYNSDALITSLSSDPLERGISAEFLVRYVQQGVKAMRTGPALKEELIPMNPRGAVWIGSSNIVYGIRPHQLIEFQYKVEKRDSWLWLILESKHVRLELIKLVVEFNDKDFKNSHVVAPIKGYSEEYLAELKTRYSSKVTKERTSELKQALEQR